MRCAECGITMVALTKKKKYCYDCNALRAKKLQRENFKKWYIRNRERYNRKRAKTYQTKKVIGRKAAPPLVKRGA